MDGAWFPCLAVQTTKRGITPLFQCTHTTTFLFEKMIGTIILYDEGGKELYDLKKDPEEWVNLAGVSEYKRVIRNLNKHIPNERKEYVKTKPIRWAEVLSGETKFYK